MAERGGSYQHSRKRWRKWETKRKKEEENITTDVYILGQCNQVENKKRKTIKDTAEQKCDQIKIREELIKTRYNVIVD